MEGVGLKHYVRYRRSIERYAASVGIKIVHGNGDDDGVYVASRRIVRIDPEMDESTEIAVLLHELGHALDTFLMIEKSQKRLEKAYTAVYADRHSPNQRKEVIRCEKRAWQLGRILAKQLHIRLGKWYVTAQTQYLKTYRE